MNFIPLFLYVPNARITSIYHYVNLCSIEDHTHDRYKVDRGASGMHTHKPIVISHSMDKGKKV